MTARATTANRLTPHPWAASKLAEGAAPRTTASGAAAWPPSAGPCSSGSRASNAGWAGPARSPAPARPAARPCPPRTAPVHPSIHRPNRGVLQEPLRQGDERAGRAVKQDRARKRRTASSGPGRRSARRPRRTSRRSGPRPRWPARQGGTRCPCDAASSHTPRPTWIQTAAAGDGDRVVAPDRGHGVVEVLDPARRGGRGRLDHLRGHAERHRRLALEDAVEDPEEAEGDPK